MRQRDAKSARQKGNFFRSKDNSPFPGHLTRRSLLCQYDGSIIAHYGEIARGQRRFFKTGWKNKALAIGENL
jgi:hypothetical protein